MTDTVFSDYAPVVLPYETSVKLRLLSEAAGMGPSEYLDSQLFPEPQTLSESSDQLDQSS